MVASVAMSATFPGQTYGLGLIKEPLRADLGISDLQFNLFLTLTMVRGLGQGDSPSSRSFW